MEHKFHSKAKLGAVLLASTLCVCVPLAPINAKALNLHRQLSNQDGGLEIQILVRDLKLGYSNTQVLNPEIWRWLGVVLSRHWPHLELALEPASFFHGLPKASGR